MSDSSRHALFSVRESVYGTTPTTPAFKTVRHTGTTLGLSKTAIVSQELRADRQIADYRHGTRQVGGDISTELSYGSYDDLFEALLGGTWAVKAAPFISTGISAAASDQSINVAAGTSQVETATAAGTVTLAGDALVTVTGAGIPGSPLVLAVPVDLGDTAAVWAGKVRTALAANAAITSLYVVSGATTGIILTRILAAANDATLNIALTNGTCTGITPAASSADTTAGVANFPALTAGDKITIAGFTGTSANNQTVKVVTSSPTKIVVVAAVPLVDDAAGESVTITTLTGVLKAGVTRRSFSTLRQFTDMDSGTKPFHLFTGVEYNKLTLKLAVNAIVTAVFSVLGQDLGLATAGPASGSYAVPNTNSPMDAFSGSLYEAGVLCGILTELTLSLENGIDGKFVVGSKVTLSPSIGRSNQTGSTTAYFEDSNLMLKFINETESSIVVNIGDPAGNSYRATLPRIKYNGGQPDTQGQGAITLALPIQALYDATTGTNIMIERNAA